MSATRAERIANLERWADEVSGDDLRPVDTDALRQIVELVDQRQHLEKSSMPPSTSRAPRIGRGRKSEPCSA